MRALAVLLLALVAGCSSPKQDTQAAVDTAVQTATEAVAGAIEQPEDVQEAAAPAATAVVLAAREAVAEVVTEPLPPPVPAGRQQLDPAVVALVVRWEVGSPAQYTRKYQGVICPGGASGPTIGIGYDLGTQTAADIRARWAWHPDVDALVTASGQTGPAKCIAWRKQHMGIRVGYDDAIRVFTQYDWPAYMAMASRAYRNGWSGLSLAHQNGLGSNGYNRGFTFVGSRRAEMREIRATCVPHGDAPCTAGQLRASCRVWIGTEVYNGLCARRHAEADFVIRPT